MPKLNLNLPTIVAALCGSVFLTACPGDDTGGTGTETEGDSTSTGPSVTTMPPPTTNPPDTTTTDDTTTVGLDDTSTMGTPDTTTTGDDTTGTTGDDTTEGGSESTTDEPPPPAMGYGDCGNLEPSLACLPDEICGNDPVGNSSCLGQGCMADADCIVPASGDAVPTCLEITGDAVSECYLSCAMGETCPDGMMCVLDYICVWEFVPGLCPDEDLGNTVPQSVMGDNFGLKDDWQPSCGPGGHDASYQFTASADGTYVFDTAGSAIDTVLGVLDGCGGPELDCNDDVAMGDPTSEITIVLTAGQSVIIVVDTFDAVSGPFNLNVSAM